MADKYLDNEITVTNNIPNTTATGTKADLYSGSVLVTAADGFKITVAKISYTDGYGDYVEDEAMTISEGGKTASWENSDFDVSDGVTLSGETESEGTTELKVTNNIADTTEEHTYDGTAASFTVTSAKYPRNRFIDPKVNYTDTSGQAQSVAMDVEVLQYNSVATATVTDIDPSKEVIIMGRFISVWTIETDLTTCQPETALPDYVMPGDTLTVTLVADDGTEFQTEHTPYINYIDDEGLSADALLTISEDKKTATISFATPAIVVGYLHLVGETYPKTVIGGNYGAINVYKVTLENLSDFATKRFFKETSTDTTTGATVYENVDLGVYVNRIKRIFADIPAAAPDVIRCGNYNTEINVLQPTQDKITLDFGDVTVPAHNNDNVDYEGESKIFLPFGGFVNIPTDYVGHPINLQYVINVITGGGVAKLLCDGVTFQVETVTPCNDVLYRTADTDRLQTVGGDNWNEMLFYGLEPYVYCKWYDTASNGRNNDRIRGKIGDFRGFNAFGDITPIHTPEMLTDEQETIYSLLASGVYVE